MTLAQLTLMAVMLLYYWRAEDALHLRDKVAEEAHVGKVIAAMVLLAILAIWRLTA